jgi:dUTP pyrophosphatase
MILEYYKTHGNVFSPFRANPSDAGLDICYSPEVAKNIEIPPNGSAVIPTGLKFGIPHGYMLEVKNRSGMAAKRSLLVGACVVDSGYNGEVFINLHNVGFSYQTIKPGDSNVGFSYQTIKPGDRIAQVVLIPVVHFRAIETAEDNLYGWYPITISDRGEGKLGSTDEKTNN